jgi:hypothetical protein
VFLVTAMAVYVWIAVHPRPTSTDRGGLATSVVRVESPPRNAAIQPALALPSTAALRSQLVTEENLSKALAHCDPRWSLPQAMEKIRHNLQITAQRSGDSQDVLISLSLADDDLRFASGVINALAERYCEGCRTKLRDDVRRNHQAAAQSLDESRQQVRRVKAELEGFLERHFRASEELARKTLAASTAPVTSPAPVQPAPTVVAKPVLVDNPDWVRLHEQLQVKRRALVEMLMVRTPLHPDAQALQTDISDLERRLLATPRQLTKSVEEPVASATPVATPTTTATPAATRATNVPGMSAEEMLEAAQTFTVLSGELRRAADSESQLAEAERLAWQEQFRVPNVKLTVSAQPALVPATAGSRILWVALIAATAVTSGVGMIFSRPGTDPVIGSVEQAEQALGVPVLGVVHACDLAEDESPEPADARGSLAWLAGGMACIAGAVVLVLISG